MKKTEHFGLSQWEPSDRLQMEGFNNDNAKIDAALAELAGSVRLAPEMHRIWFRGKKLGDSPTADQQAAIQAGTFEDLYLGDYWEVDGVKWRIVDIDYWLFTGYFGERMERHHVLVMPDTALYQASMNDEYTTGTGYVNSTMRTANLAQAEEIINNIFGNMVLSHIEQCVSQAESGWPVKYEWIPFKAIIPSETMMFGHETLDATRRFSACDAIAQPQVRYNISNSQLALFQVAPKFKVAKSKAGDYVDIWLRDIKSSVAVAGIANASGGVFSCMYVNKQAWVRPVFAIG